MLVLTCVPCHDSALAHSRHEDKAAVAVLDAHHASGHCHADLCSPFCACACCAGITLTQAVTMEVVVEDASPEVQPVAYVSRTPKSIAATIWQPPRAGV